MSFIAGPLSVAVWENESEANNYHTVSFERRYVAVDIFSSMFVLPVCSHKFKKMLRAHPKRLRMSREGKTCDDCLRGKSRGWVNDYDRLC